MNSKAAQRFWETDSEIKTHCKASKEIIPAASEGLADGQETRDHSHAIALAEDMEATPQN